MRSAPLNHIVVLGNDIAAWLSAAVLARAHKGLATRITVCTAREPVESMARQTLLPHFLDLVGALKSDPATFVRRTAATYKLADRLVNWCAPSTDFYHATGDYGVTLGGVEFHQALTRLREAGDTPWPIERYSLAATSALEGKFAPSNSDPRSIMSTFRYGCTIETAALRSWCQEICRETGVEVVDQAVAGVSLDASGETIQQLTLDEGQVVQPDLYVDTTRAGQLHQGLGVARTAWNGDLPAGRQYQFTSSGVESRPISTLEATPYGWLKYTSSQRGSSATVHCAPEGLEQTTLRDIARELGAEPIGEAEQSAFMSERPWSGNCISIGPAAIELPSPSVSEVDLAWLGLGQLLEHLPGAPVQPTLASAYNRRLTAIYRNLKDYTRLYFLLARDRDEPFWHARRCAPVSSSLEYKLALFDRRGKLPFLEDEVIPAGWQIWLLLGLDRWPDKIDPVACLAKLDELREHSRKIQQAVGQAAAKMPMHTALWGA